MVTDRTIISKVQEFGLELLEQGVHLREIYLFGSYARGEQNEWSDVDIALVADSFTGVSFEDVKQFIDVTIQKPYFLFEYHTFNTQDFIAGDPFIDEIKRTGIPIALAVPPTVETKLPMPVSY
jgi:predicted nucleotidyltransferase